MNKKVKKRKRQQNKQKKKEKQSNKKQLKKKQKQLKEKHQKINQSLNFQALCDGHLKNNDKPANVDDTETDKRYNYTIVKKLSVVVEEETAAIVKEISE